MPEEIEVPTEHLHEKMHEEVHGHGEGHGHGGAGWIARVAVSSALLAVAAAISALLAGHHANEAILEQMKATDQWQYYQAKSIKLAVLQGGNELLEADGKPVSDKRKGKVNEYQTEMKEIEEKGHELEESSEHHMGRHVWIARSVTAFQIAIALGAIAVLAKRPKLWWLSLGLGALGGVLLVFGIM